MRSLVLLSLALLAVVPACRRADKHSRLALRVDAGRAQTADLEALLLRALPAIRTRVDAICFSDGEVTRDRDRILVRVARTSDDELARLARDLTRRSELALRLLGGRRGDRPARLDGRAVTAMTLVGAAAPVRARVVVAFDPASREQLAWVTATNLGSRLVLTIDGELSAAAMITRRVDDGEWRARPAAPQSVLKEGTEVPPLSYRQLLALDHRLRAALTVPLRWTRDP